MKSVFAVLLMTLCVACGEGEVGPKGDPGPQGVAGAPGPKGDPGAPGISIAHGRSCFGSPVEPWGVTGFEYDAWEFNDGSAFVSCDVSLSDFDTYTGGFTPRTGTRNCTIGDDLDSPSFGYWSFVPTSTQVVVTYHDPGSSYDGRSYTMGCTVY